MAVVGRGIWLYLEARLPGDEPRDQRSISRMVTRSLIAGLMSVGIDIQNLDATSIPVARAVVPPLGCRWYPLHPDRPDYILIEFIDQKELISRKRRKKKIEGGLFQGRFAAGANS